MIDLRLHAPALVGCLALLLAAVVGLGVVPRWQADRATAETAWRQQASQRAASAQPTPAVQAGSRLVPALPDAAELPRRLAALVALANRHGITPDGLRQPAPVRLGSGAATLPAERVPLRMTGSAPYLAWRSFVAEALQQDDALLLDQVQIGRADAAAAVLSADLQWSLLQRTGPADTGVALAPAAAGGRRLGIP